SFMAKKVFRLTVPVFIRIFHLNREGVIALQAVLGFLLIFFSYKLANRILKDAPSATMIAAGIAFIYAGRGCFTDITYTHFDGWAYFFILMTLYSRNFLAVFLFATMSAWVDERGTLALVFPILFHQMEAAKDKNFSLPSLIRPAKLSMALLLSVAGYIALRLYLTHTYNMHTPSDDANFSDLKQNFIHTSFGFGAFTFLEGFWLLFPIVLLTGIRNKHYMAMTMITGLILIFSLAVFCVNDLTRSGSYLFSIIFVFLAYLRQFTETSYFRSIAAVCLFFCFIFPPINYVAFGDFLYRVEKPFLWILIAILQQH
ncbi:MAG TPA: hypothetical protein VE035_06005, partial [Puia sp.]|nr:hypothetical protein [Puia sp.]